MDGDADASNLIFKIIFLFILIILSAFFSSAETSFMRVNKIKIKELANSMHKSAKRVERILKEKDKMLSAILIGNNCVNLFASSITSTLFYELYGNAIASAATGILTFIILVFGEIIPKTIASKHAERITMIYSGPILGIMNLFTPIIFLINKFSYLIMTILKINKDKPETTLTEETIKTIVDVGQEEGILQESEHELIQNVFEFADSCAKDIMIPRTSIVGIKENSSYDDIMSTFKNEKYTRLVVYNEQKEDIIGVINIRDMIHVDKDNFNINDIMRKPCITFEFKKISDLLKEMKMTSNNMAIIIDEYGETVGLLTLEDILEELVGEIRDEYDEDELSQIIKNNNGNYELSGIMKIDDVNKELNLEIESEDYDTIGGYIIQQLDRLPLENEIIECKNLSFKILHISNNRIERIELEIKN